MVCDAYVQPIRKDNIATEFNDVVILPTAQVYLQNHNNKYGPFTALCDTAAHINLIRMDVVQGLKLNIENCHFNLWGVNDKVPTIIKHRVRLKLLNNKMEDLNLTLDLICVPTITGLLPPIAFTMPHIANFNKIALADPTFNSPKPVDILLGGHTWAKISVKKEAFNISEDIVAQPTNLGLLIIGKTLQNGSGIACVMEAIVQTPSVKQNADAQLDFLLKRLWEVEHTPNRVLSKEQQLCEEVFVKQHFRDENGRFVVMMPLKPNIDVLGDSRAIALRRFYQLERRFKRDSEMHTKYIEFMTNYEESGHMQIADAPPDALTNYLPHHSVPKEKKFRVVFDASATTENNLSLNDTQMVGERLQSNIVDILFRFRCFKIGFSADVVQMYRQVKINRQQWDLQRVFWRRNENEDLREYWLTCVTQGMACAAHCAVRAMIQCGSDGKVTFPLAADVIQNNFYMDDCTAGAHDSHLAIETYKQLNECLATGGFQLNKWMSNDSQFLENIGVHSRQSSEQVLKIEHSAILGVNWVTTNDQLTIKLNLADIRVSYTKRQILSALARLYDPCGFIAPVIIVGRMLMQEIWISKIDWDSKPAQEISKKFHDMYNQLNTLESLKIPRWFGCNLSTGNEIHGFCDASSRAYGCVLYMRVKADNGDIHTTIIGAKSRVAPIKTMSIPRLELCAAALLAEFAATTIKECKIPISKVTLWTDSAVALQWIQRLPIELQVMVANKVSNIQELTTGMFWRHVPSKQNAADIISRGLRADELLKNDMWLYGPKWLKQDETQWPNRVFSTSETEKKQIQAETKTKQFVCAVINVKHDGFTLKKDALMINGELISMRRSTLSALLRVTANIFRAVKLFTKQQCASEFIKTDEYQTALVLWIKIEQNSFYQNEISALQRKSIDSIRNSPLSNLTPFLDEDEILRVGGRIDNAELTFEEKHPIILPEKSRLAHLLILDTHKRTFHGGIQVMAAVIRQKYWIPKLRQQLKHCVSRCVTCVRFKAKTMEQLMSILPKERVRITRCFRNVGVDYAGPIVIRAKHDIRNPRLAKAYLCIFVCLVTKAVHIEVAENLTTDAFLDAFNRMTARRGNADSVWSDNAKNFVGAYKELRQTIDNIISDPETQKKLNTRWHFITPLSPHQGGLWESMVKTTKHYLHRMTKNQIFSLPALNTLVIQIEAIINSRPLTALSDDVNDLSPLTPAHFIIGEPLVQPFHPWVTDIPDNRLKPRALIQKFTQQFADRFQTEYIRQLQQRFKWKTKEMDIKLNDLVIVKNDQLPPTLWQLGRIVTVHPGNDGIIRNVTVKTEAGYFQRSIQHLCKLPTEDECLK